MNKKLFILSFLLAFSPLLSMDDPEDTALGQPTSSHTDRIIRQKLESLIGIEIIKILMISEKGPQNVTEGDQRQMAFAHAAARKMCIGFSEFLDQPPNYVSLVGSKEQLSLYQAIKNGQPLWLLPE